LSALLVCSKSTREFLPKYDRVRMVSSAPTKDILSEVSEEEDVVAIGGGAVIDTAKIISKNSIHCYPTTAAGSSATSWSVYWDGSKKCSLKRMIPYQISFIPEFIKNLPHEIVVETTYDVVSHCLDSLYSKNSTKKSISHCNYALEFLRNKKDNLDLIQAGHIAGKAIEITGTNLLHSLSYPLTGHYGIPHGVALGYFLLKISKFMNYDVSDIIEDFNYDLDVDIDFVIDEALTYDKIHDTNKVINKKILKGILK